MNVPIYKLLRSSSILTSSTVCSKFLLRTLSLCHQRQFPSDHVLFTNRRGMSQVASDVQECPAVQTDLDGKLPTEPDGRQVDVKEENPQQKIVKRNKFALLLSYCGYGYKGLQVNPGQKTIEGEVFRALLETGQITQEQHDCNGKIYFQRAARTDKGVSAAVQVLSLQLPRDFDEKNVAEMNDHLPPEIRIFGSIKTTKYFDSKNFCDGRTYSYMMPTFTLCPLDVPVTEGYRAPPEVINEFNKILGIYRGTHNFHNFTSGKDAVDASAKRHIVTIEASNPFVMDGLEWTVVRIRGQSFMLHQIRKMIGMAIAVARGYCNLDSLKSCFDIDKIDVPRAPGSGLMLEDIHYDRYNKKFGGDGHHELLNWDRWSQTISTFKKDFIYPVMVRSEKEEKNMFNWMQFLALHTYEKRDPESFLEKYKFTPRTPIALALAQVVSAKGKEVAVDEEDADDDEDLDDEDKDDDNDDFSGDVKRLKTQ